MHKRKRERETSSINSTPGTSSAMPCSMYLFTTCLELSRLFLAIHIIEVIISVSCLVLEVALFEDGFRKGRRGGALLISSRSFSVISVFRGFISCPIIEMMSAPTISKSRQPNA
jgi:hypothetical protein